MRVISLHPHRTPQKSEHASRPSAQGRRKRDAPRRMPRCTAVPARLTYTQSAARAVSSRESATFHGVYERLQCGGISRVPVSMKYT